MEHCGREVGARKPEAARILIADDSAVVRTIVRRTLEEGGYCVDEAEDGSAALARLEKAAYDVVITDLKMPEVDGFGVLSGVKERSLNTEVIILTGTLANDTRSAVRALRLGAHDYLTKPPSSSEEMLVTVERAIEKKRLRDANLRLLRELEAMSRTDALTGLLNRRSFDDVFPREVARAHRYDFPLALVVLDMDRFKQINDGYGHQGGDEALRAMAGIASRVFRDTDSLYRYGGEEFVVLLPHTTATGARQGAERLLRELRNASIRVGDAALKVTCSAGVAELEAGDGDGAPLLSRADEALYAAKEAGRDRVEMHLKRAHLRRRVLIA